MVEVIKEPDAHTDTLRAFVDKWIGSVASGTYTEESDLDVLIDPTPDTTLFDIGAIRYKLKQLLGISVDVLTPRALPEKFRQSVLDSALTI